MYGVYLLLGPEKGLKEDFINKIKNSLGECEITRFYAVEDYEENLFAQLSGDDLFCAKKLVILDEAQEIKTKEKAAPIAEYLKNPSDTITFLILSDELYIHPDIMGAVKNQSEQIVKFYELFENKKTEWINNFFVRNNLTIDKAACEAIIEKVENSIQEFQNVCSQLVIYAKTVEGKNTVTESDVDEFLSHTRQETEFTLFGYMAKGKLESALECLHTLINTNDNASLAAVVCSRLSLYFKRVYSIHKVIKSGTSSEEALKVKYFDSDRPITMLKDKEIYREALKRFSARDLERIIVTLAEYDIKVKESGTALSQMILEKCICDIVANKGRHVKKAVFASVV